MLAAPQEIFFGGLCGGSLDWLKLLLPVFLGEGSLYKIWHLSSNQKRNVVYDPASKTNLSRHKIKSRMCTVLHYSNIPTADHYKQICVSGKLEYFDWESMRSSRRHLYFYSRATLGKRIYWFILIFILMGRGARRLYTYRWIWENHVYKMFTKYAWDLSRLQGKMIT